MEFAKRMWKICIGKHTLVLCSQNNFRYSGSHSQNKKHISYNKLEMEMTEMQNCPKVLRKCATLYIVTHIRIISLFPHSHNTGLKFLCIKYFHQGLINIYLYQIYIFFE